MGKPCLEKRTPLIFDTGASLCRAACMGLLALLFGTADAGAEEIDRLLAAVNGTVITEGDLLTARSLNRLNSPTEETIAPSLEEELERFIDLELVRQEMNNFSGIPEDDDSVSVAMKELRDDYGGEGGLQAQLERIGVLESELIAFLKLEIAIFNFIEFRFYPFAAGVSPEDIETYYNDSYVPQLKESGIEVPPLETVSSKIRDLLVEERINADMDRWIRQSRRNARIEYFIDYGPDQMPPDDLRRVIPAGKEE